MSSFCLACRKVLICLSFNTSSTFTICLLWVKLIYFIFFNSLAFKSFLRIVNFTFFTTWPFFSDSMQLVGSSDARSVAAVLHAVIVEILGYDVI